MACGGQKRRMRNRRRRCLAVDHHPRAVDAVDAGGHFAGEGVVAERGEPSGQQICPPWVCPARQMSAPAAMAGSERDPGRCSIMS